jgi:hypothetical protein
MISLMRSRTPPSSPDSDPRQADGISDRDNRPKAQTVPFSIQRCGPNYFREPRATRAISNTSSAIFNPVLPSSERTTTAGPDPRLSKCHV